MKQTKNRTNGITLVQKLITARIKTCKCTIHNWRTRKPNNKQRFSNIQTKSNLEHYKQIG